MVGERASDDEFNDDEEEEVEDAEVDVDRSRARSSGGTTSSSLASSLASSLLLPGSAMRIRPTRGRAGEASFVEAAPCWSSALLLLL